MLCRTLAGDLLKHLCLSGRMRWPWSGFRHLYNGSFRDGGDRAVESRWMATLLLTPRNGVPMLCEAKGGRNSPEFGGGQRVLSRRIRIRSEGPDRAAAGTSAPEGGTANSNDQSKRSRVLLCRNHFDLQKNLWPDKLRNDKQHESRPRIFQKLVPHLRVIRDIPLPMSGIASP